MVSGAVKTIYIGAQGAFDAATGTIVGRGEIGIQARQVLKNIQAALAAAAANLEHLIKWTIYLLFSVYRGHCCRPPVRCSLALASRHF